MTTSPLATVRRHIAHLTGARDLQPVADALHAGGVHFQDAPNSILDLWSIDSALHAWEERLAAGPLSAADTQAMLADLNAGWQGVAALLAGGMSPD